MRPHPTPLDRASGRPIPLLGISQGWSYAPLVVCGGLIVLFSIEQVALDILRPGAPEQRGAAAAFLE